MSTVTMQDESDGQLEPAIRDTGHPIAISFLSAVVGGTIGWICAFAGLGPWGLAIGLATGAIALIGSARIFRLSDRISTLAAFVCAFALLTWPFLWVAVGYARYLITGEGLGD